MVGSHKGTYDIFGKEMCKYGSGYITPPDCKARPMAEDGKAYN